MIKKLVFVSLLSGVGAFAATWTGQLSDSACGMSHAKMLSSDKSLKTDKDCTLACIKGGSKYVLVVEGKVYDISNQKLAALQQHAGETVEVTGTMKGDSITVSKVSAAKGK